LAWLLPLGLFVCSALELQQELELGLEAVLQQAEGAGLAEAEEQHELAFEAGLGLVFFC
jgi:hypothetical protein